jgi:hypothetical protein
MMPVSVAFDSPGRLFIADEGAQRIRVLADGVVSTIAGSGSIAQGVHVPGGYRDGPALQARFNEPSGIVVDGNGTIYVADELNHCIRKISAGTVTTYAGSPTKPGSSDGTRATATFTSPRALALDGSGDLYVADYTVGIRKIDPAGTVTTVPMSPVGERRFVGVAAVGRGNSLVLFATSAEGRYFSFRPAIDGDQVHDDIEGSAIPHAFGVAAVNDDVFLATDIQANVIREFRLSEPPYVTQFAAPVVAGVAYQDGTLGAGFHDGPLLEARFYAPLGIAIHGDQIAVADAGNRRIRALQMIDVRRPVAGDVSQFAPDPSSYRVVFVGASHSFWATDWSTSSPGLIEANLNANRLRLGIPKRVRMSVVRLDSTGLDGQVDFIRSSGIMAGGVNLVILGLTPSDLFGVLAGPGQSLARAQAILRELNSDLGKSGCRLFVYLKPEPSDISLVDDMIDRLRASSFHEETGMDSERQAAIALSTSGVENFVALNDYLAYEHKRNEVPLWAYNDSHEDAAGRAFVANEILKALIAWKPWAR